MKKKLIVLICGAALILPNLIVSASDDKLEISCEKTKLNANESTTCIVSANITDKEISAVDATISLGENLTLGEVTVSDIWEGDGDGGRITVYTDENKSGTFDIATFEITANNVSGVDTSVSLTNVLLSDQNFDESSYSVESLEIRINSNVNTLADLKVDGQTVEGFDPETKEYTLKFDKDRVSVNIVAEKTDSYSKVTGNIGTLDLRHGMNNFVIIVTSESGIENKYYINIVREEFLDMSLLDVDEDKLLIKELVLNTKISELKEKILTSGTITIVDKNNKVLTNSDNLKSGAKVTIELSNETYTYTLSVKGDITGTGTSTVSDVAKLYQYMRGKIDMEDCYIEAGNVVGDTLEIKVNDVAKLYQYIKEKIDSLEG